MKINITPYIDTETADYANSTTSYATKSDADFNTQLTAAKKAITALSVDTVLSGDKKAAFEAAAVLSRSGRTDLQAIGNVMADYADSSDSMSGSEAATAILQATGYTTTTTSESTGTSDSDTSSTGSTENTSVSDTDSSNTASTGSTTASGTDASSATSSANTGVSGTDTSSSAAETGISGTDNSSAASTESTTASDSDNSSTASESATASDSANPSAVTSSGSANLISSTAKNLTCSTELESYFLEAAEKYQVDINLLKAIAKTESNFDPSATSSSGAMGVMQLMPFVAEELGISDAYDAHDNIMGGASVIASHLEKYDGDLSLALAAYNAGSGAVDRCGGIPTSAANYVKKVLGFYAEA